MEANVLNVLREIPFLQEGLEEDYVPMHSFGNQNYRVRCRADEYVVRIPGPFPQVIADRAAEQHNASLAYDRGWNPFKVAWFDPDTGRQVTHYRSDVVGLKSEQVLGEHFDGVCALLKEIHTSGVDFLGKIDPIARTESIIELAKEKGIELPPTLQEVFGRLKDAVASISVERVPLHGDVHFSNLLVDSKVRLCDWEFSGMGVPGGDIARWAALEGASSDDAKKITRGIELTERGQMTIPILRPLTHIDSYLWARLEEQQTLPKLPVEMLQGIQNKQATAVVRCLESEEFSSSVAYWKE